MDSITSVQKKLKDSVRAKIQKLAARIDKKFNGKIKPDDITVAALAAHFPIAFLISQDQLFVAGVLLIIFGLFDLLDGALARLQNTAGPRGMFLDASTDRIKETLIYTGFAALFASEGNVLAALICVLALGLSVSVSYVKAKGEAALALQKPGMDHAKLNRIFEDGLGSLETRMTLIILGCLLRLPELAIFIILILCFWTIIVRTGKILKELS